jgi:hypothetical protein
MISVLWYVPSFLLVNSYYTFEEDNTFKFNIHGSVRRNNILIEKSQQDAHVTEFILSDVCSTCFGYHCHPSSGAQNNCNYSIW